MLSLLLSTEMAPTLDERVKFFGHIDASSHKAVAEVPHKHGLPHKDNLQLDVFMSLYIFLVLIIAFSNFYLISRLKWAAPGVEVFPACLKFWRRSRRGDSEDAVLGRTAGNGHRRLRSTATQTGDDTDQSLEIDKLVVEEVLVVPSWSDETPVSPGRLRRLRNIADHFAFWKCSNKRLSGRDIELGPVDSMVACISGDVVADRSTMSLIPESTANSVSRTDLSVADVRSMGTQVLRASSDPGNESLHFPNSYLHSRRSSREISPDRVIAPAISDAPSASPRTSIAASDVSCGSSGAANTAALRPRNGSDIDLEYGTIDHKSLGSRESYYDDVEYECKLSNMWLGSFMGDSGVGLRGGAIEEKKKIAPQKLDWKERVQEGHQRRSVRLAVIEQKRKIEEHERMKKHIYRLWMDVRRLDAPRSCICDECRYCQGWAVARWVESTEDVAPTFDEIDYGEETKLASGWKFVYNTPDKVSVNVKQENDE